MFAELVKKFVAHQDSENCFESDCRYERKFVVDAYTPEQIELIIKHHPAIFREIYHQRFINNIYFDTPNLRFYSDNVAGKSHRRKVRIRWYGNTFGQVSRPVLEIKQKQGVVGNKLSYPLKPFELKRDFRLDHLHGIFENSDLPQNLLIEIYDLMPALLNGYSRRYFQSFIKGFRVTVDHKLAYTHISPNLNSCTNRIDDHRNAIVEVKYRVKYEKRAEEILSRFPFRLSKSSKYVNGIKLFNHGLAE